MQNLLKSSNSARNSDHRLALICKEKSWIRKMRKSANMFRLPMHSVVDTLSNAQPSDWTAVGGKAKASRRPDVLSPEEVGGNLQKKLVVDKKVSQRCPSAQCSCLLTCSTGLVLQSQPRQLQALQLTHCNYIFVFQFSLARRSKETIRSSSQGAMCHLTTTHGIGFTLSLFMLNVKQRSCECQLIFVVWLTSVSWSSGNAFVSGAGGLGFKSRAGQIGHSVANS